jgi:hypothetical protein
MSRTQPGSDGSQRFPYYRARIGRVNPSRQGQNASGVGGAHQVSDRTAGVSDFMSDFSHAALAESLGEFDANY